MSNKCYQNFTKEIKQEIRDNFEVDKDGFLTLNGFIQMYSLQTTADEEETYKDLHRNGFDRNLKPI